MLSGKAVSRAIRGHFLVEAALTTKLLTMLLPHRYVSQREESFDQSAIPRDDTELEPENEEEDFVGVVSSSIERKEECLNEDEFEELLDLFRKLKENERN